jgi:hypothetical protein
MIFARTVRYKVPGNVFYRRVRRVKTLTLRTLSDGTKVYCATRISGAATLIPVFGSVVEWGRKVQASV